MFLIQDRFVFKVMKERALKKLITFSVGFGLRLK